MSVTRSILLPLAAAVLACADFGPQPESISLALPRDSVVADSAPFGQTSLIVTVSFRVTNHGPWAIYLGPCEVRVQHLVGEVWSNFMGQACAVGREPPWLASGHGADLYAVLIVSRASIDSTIQGWLPTRRYRLVVDPISEQPVGPVPLPSLTSRAFMVVPYSPGRP